MEDAYEAVGLCATRVTFSPSRFSAAKRKPSRCIRRRCGPTSGKRPSTSIAFPTSNSGRHCGATIRWNWWRNSCRRALWKADGGIRMNSSLAVIRNRKVAALSGPVVPRLIAASGTDATMRFLNFFATQIENDNTRSAYLRAARESWDYYICLNGMLSPEFETFFGLAPSGAIPPSRRPSPDTPSAGRNVPWRAGSHSGPS
jgi:hypothetical protein